MIPREVREAVTALRAATARRGPTPLLCSSGFDMGEVNAYDKVLALFDAHDAAEVRERAADFAERGPFDMP